MWFNLEHRQPASLTRSTRVSLCLPVPSAPCFHSQMLGLGLKHWIGTQELRFQLLIEKHFWIWFSGMITDSGHQAHLKSSPLISLIGIPTHEIWIVAVYVPKYCEFVLMALKHSKYCKHSRNIDKYSPKVRDILIFSSDICSLLSLCSAVDT